MQGWHYGKGLIYLRPIFRLTKLAFLKARAMQKENAITAVLFNYTSIDVWLQHLYTRDPARARLSVSGDERRASSEKAGE